VGLYHHKAAHGVLSSTLEILGERLLLVRGFIWTFLDSTVFLIVLVNVARSCIVLFILSQFLMNHQTIADNTILPTMVIEIVEITPMETPWSYYVVRGGAILVCVYGWHVLCVASAVSAASIALTATTPMMGALIYEPGTTDLRLPLRIQNPGFPRRERASLVPDGEPAYISSGKVAHPELDGVMRDHISDLGG